MSLPKNSPLPRTEMDALLLGRLDELTVSCESSSRGKNYLGVLMSILVLMLISSIIVAAIVIINPEIVTLSTKSYTPREPITLEESMLGGLSPVSFASQWLPPTAAATTVASGNVDEPQDVLLFEDSKNLNFITMPTREQLENMTLVRLEFQPNVTTLVSNTSLISSIQSQGYKISPSKRYLLIWTNKKKQFRHSFTAKYFLYDIKSDLITTLGTHQLQRKHQSTATSTHEENDGGEFSQTKESSYNNSYENLDSATQYLNAQDGGDEFARFQLVDWFTSGNGEDSLILIQNNDIYLMKNVSNADNGSIRQMRLTFTGKENEIFNGVPDWLYEEEILADTPAYQVSPFGSSLAYMSFNDSRVDLMPFTIYGSNEQIIPKIQRIRYPKAGRVNPRVRVRVIDNLAASAETNGAVINDVELKFPQDLARRQHYIQRIKWLTNEKLALVWLNRKQNESYVLVCSRALQWNCEKNLYLRSNGGWLDMSDDLYPLDEDHYLTLLLKNEGDDVGSFKHVAKVSLRQENSYIHLTRGRKEVLSIEAVDQKNSLVYYTSTPENEPGQRQLYSASLNAKPTSEQLGGSVCLTCDHHPNECLYNFARMSPSSDYYIFECDGPGVPRTELRWTRKRPVVKAPVASKQLNGIKSSPSSITNPRYDHDDHIKSSTSRDQVLGANDNVLWAIENNQVLRDKLAQSKAMPLTMRLKVPIPGTNYSANVMMLLPPQLGPTTTFRPSSSASAVTKNANRLKPRQAEQRSIEKERQQTLAASFQASAERGIEQPVHSYFTPDSIVHYTNQLTSGQQYPMVVSVYGGPGSQKVDYRFSINFGHYLASSRRTIYVMIDGRGSGFEGTKRLYELYHKFGSVEIEDQIEVSAYLTRAYSFIDPNKVGIWGWSYGGYAAAMALAKSNERPSLSRPVPAQSAGRLEQLKQDAIFNETNYKGTSSLGSQLVGGVFECAASVAPVTDWIYYDTAYTERYMSSPYSSELFAKDEEEETIDERSSHFNAPATSSGLMKTAAFVAQRYPSPLSLPSIAAEPMENGKWLPLNQTVDGYLPQPLGSMHRSLPTPANKINSINQRYKTASLLEHINKVDRKRFLLVHGTADDNVHFQQSIMLMKRLIRKNVLFETQLYPDQDHGIANKADKYHLGSTLSKFFAECFDMAY